jgi:hypothetical protein
MAVTRAQFLADFPQFDEADVDLVDSRLATAARRVGAAWGDLQDDGIKYLTAHMLALDPRGEASARAPGTAGSDNWSKTTYLVEFERLRDEARSGFFGSVSDPDAVMT